MGERSDELVSVDNVTIEQILSGRIEPVEYDEDDDEFAIVLAGAAVLDVEGERVALDAGDWVFLPAHTRHELLHAEPGTNWLTVRVYSE